MLLLIFSLLVLRAMHVVDRNKGPISHETKTVAEMAGVEYLFHRLKLSRIHRHGVLWIMESVWIKFERINTHKIILTIT